MEQVIFDDGCPDTAGNNAKEQRERTMQENSA
jgi:hypothetical protein